LGRSERVEPMNSLDPPADQSGDETPEGGQPAPVSRFDEAILRVAAKRGEAKSFTPTEVASELAEDWRPLLAHVRAAARRLAVAGRIDILRHGKPIDPAAMKGVIRLRLKQG
jgi:Protein of unknown function (DUF3253)